MGGASALKAVGSLASSAASAGGGKGGSNNSGGGISPQEAALAAYNAGQQTLASNTTHATTGTGMSTGTTYGDAGANIGMALAEAQQSDANLAGQNAVNQAQQSSNLSSLSSLASNASFGSGFGTPTSTGSNLGTSTGD